jgi:hypothetical protein
MALATGYAVPRKVASGFYLNDEQALLEMYMDMRARHSSRDERFGKTARVMAREWNLRDSAGDPLQVASVNMVRTSLEDISEASATMPTIRVKPMKTSEKAKKTASGMERIALGYAAANKLRTSVARWVMDHLAFGFTPLVVLPDFVDSRPVIYKRNPRSTYPDMPTYASQVPRRVMFAERVAYGSLDPETQEMLVAQGYGVPNRREGATGDMCVRVEYVCPEEYVVGYLWSGQGNWYSAPTRSDPLVTWGWNPLITTRMELATERTPVVIIARDTFDDETRGLFDDVLDPQLAHAKVTAMAIDYVDQAVYSDVWARDVMGDLSFGGGGYIELGPNGAIGRVPPAAASLDVWRNLDALENGMHLGSRWPKSRPGQVDQAIASGKFVEATVGTMNTLLKTIHEKFAEGLQTTMALCFETDLGYFPDVDQKARGRYHNEDYLWPYVPSKDIDMDNEVAVEYGLGLGRDPSESAILMMQYQERELISAEFVQENTEGLAGIDRENQRIDLERINKMMFAALMQSVENGEMDKSILAEVYARRAEGESMNNILAEMFAPAPDTAALEEAVPPGLPAGIPPELAAALGGGGMPPGEGALPPGFAPEALPPPPPEAGELLARLNVGPGGATPTLGAQSMLGG